MLLISICIDIESGWGVLRFILVRNFATRSNYRMNIVQRKGAISMALRTAVVDRTADAGELLPEISTDFINNRRSTTKTKASADGDARGSGARLPVETCRVPEPEGIVISEWNSTRREVTLR